MTLDPYAYIVAAQLTLLAVLGFLIWRQASRRKDR